MSTTSRGYLTNFDGGRALSKVQDYPLGYVGQDRLGQRWSYVCFQEALEVGQWVQDYRSGVVTPRGGDLLPDAGEHSLALPSAFFPTAEEAVRAIGQVTAGPSVGDIFVVTQWHEAGQVSVRVIGDADERFEESKGWSVDFTGATRVQYAMPGRVIEGNTPAETIRGVVQTQVDSTDDIGKFGWVQQSGIGFCLIGTLGTVGDHRLYLANDGVFTATATGLAGEDAARALVVASSNRLVPAELHVVNNATALGGPPTKQAVGAGPAVIS